MSYEDVVAKVCKLENGYEIELYEPSKPKKGAIAPSPWKGYVFASPEETLAFLTERLPKLKPSGSEYAEGFIEATMEEED